MFVRDMTLEDRIWKEIDHSLVNLKLKSLRPPTELIGDQLSKVGTRAKLSCGWVRWLTEETYRAYCDVWRRQGRNKTAEFVTVIHRRAIVPLLHDFKDDPELIHCLEQEWDLTIAIELKECAYESTSNVSVIRFLGRRNSVGQSLTNTKTARSSNRGEKKYSFKHSPSYCRVTFDGVDYHPRKTAAKVLRALNEALQKGDPELTSDQIRSIAQLPKTGGKMYDWITKGGCRELWKTLVVEVERGVYRLDLPIPTRDATLEEKPSTNKGGPRRTS